MARLSCSNKAQPQPVILNRCLSTNFSINQYLHLHRRSGLFLLLRMGTTGSPLLKMIGSSCGLIALVNLFVPQPVATSPGQSNQEEKKPMCSTLPFHPNLNSLVL